MSEQRRAWLLMGGGATIGLVGGGIFVAVLFKAALHEARAFVVSPNAPSRALATSTRVTATAEAREDAKHERLCLVYFNARVTNVSSSDVVVSGMHLTGRYENGASPDAWSVIPPKVFTNDSIVLDDYRDPRFGHRAERAILGRDESMSFWRIVSLPVAKSG